MRTLAYKAIIKERDKLYVEGFVVVGIENFKIDSFEGIFATDWLKADIEEDGVRFKYYEASTNARAELNEKYEIFLKNEQFEEEIFQLPLDFVAKTVDGKAKVHFETTERLTNPEYYQKELEEFWNKKVN